MNENHARAQTETQDELEDGEGEGSRMPEVIHAGAQEDVVNSQDVDPPLPERNSVKEETAHGDQVVVSTRDPPPDASSTPPTPPAKPLPNPLNLPPRRESLRPTDRVVNGTPRDSIDSIDGRRVNGRGVKPRSIPSRPSSQASHRRSLTISQGHTVSVVLVSTALETIAASRDAKRSVPLKESVQRALEMVKSGEGGDRPREIFEPLRLACETRNEKLMIASLDCISKLISYSFFVESTPSQLQGLPSPPPSPGPSRNSLSGPPQGSIHPPSLIDLVVHTITSCHTESTPDSVSLQIVKALLALVLSPTTLVHQSSLLKAVRTVYNVFLLSNDPINQTVAQGGLTQMVNHVFTRCKSGGSPLPNDSTTTLSSKAGGGVASSTRGSLSSPRDSIPLPPLTPPSTTSHSNTESEDVSTTLAEEPTGTKGVSPPDVSTDSIPEPSVNGNSDANLNESTTEQPRETL